MGNVRKWQPLKELIDNYSLMRILPYSYMRMITNLYLVSTRDNLISGHVTPTASSFCHITENIIIIGIYIVTWQNTICDWVHQLYDRSQIKPENRDS